MSTTKVVAAGVTDVGRVRDHNEDSVFVDRGLSLFVVADGMGGMAGGDVASAMVVDMMRRELSRGKLAVEPEQFLREGIQRANYRVYYHSLDHPDKRGMGSTVVALAICGRRYHHAHVGDSRLYRMRQGAMQQLTEDHSLVYALFKEGKITREEMMTDRRANQISRAIGIVEEPEADFGDGRLEAGDVFLLCSDGLHGLVDDVAIIQVLSSSESPQTQAQKLIELANEKGGKDNISAIVVRIQEAADTSESEIGPPTQRSVAPSVSAEATKSRLPVGLLWGGLIGFVLGWVLCWAGRPVAGQGSPPLQVTPATSSASGGADGLTLPTASPAELAASYEPPRPTNSVASVVTPIATVAGSTTVRPLSGIASPEGITPVRAGFASTSSTSTAPATGTPLPAEPAPKTMPAQRAIPATSSARESPSGQSDATTAPAPIPFEVQPLPLEASVTRIRLFDAASTHDQVWFQAVAKAPGTLRLALQGDADLPVVLTVLGPSAPGRPGPKVLEVDCARQRTTGLDQKVELGGSGSYFVWLRLPPGRKPVEMDFVAEFAPSFCPVTFELDPVTATLKVDGETIGGGTGKLPVRLSPGRHSWIATAEGFFPGAGEFLAVDAAVVRARLELHADSSPGGAPVVDVGAPLQGTLGQPPGNARDHRAIRTPGGGDLVIRLTSGEVRWHAAVAKRSWPAPPRGEPLRIPMARESKVVLAVDAPRELRSGERLPYAFASTFEPWPRVHVALGSTPAGASVHIKDLALKNLVTPCEFESEPLRAARSLGVTLRLGARVQTVTLDLDPAQRSVTRTFDFPPLPSVPVLATGLGATSRLGRVSPVPRDDAVPAAPAPQARTTTWSEIETLESDSGLYLLAVRSCPGVLPPGARLTLDVKFTGWPVDVYVTTASSWASVDRNLLADDILRSLRPAYGRRFASPGQGTWTIQGTALPADFCIVVNRDAAVAGTITVRVDWP